MTAAATVVSVRLLDAESPSELALTAYQHLIETLDQEPERRREAAGLRGRLALEASDVGVAITLVFEGDRITVEDGIGLPVDGYVGGPQVLVTRLLSGEQSPYPAVVRRQVRIRASPGRAFFSYRVLRLMRAGRPAVSDSPRRRRWRAVSFVGSSVALTAVVVAVAFRQS